MKNKLLILLSIAMLAAFVQTAAAQSKPYTPEPGSTERKAIFDAMRANREDKDVVFTPMVFLVQNGYAWVIAAASGHANQYESDYALVRKVGGTWKFAAAPCSEEGCDMDKEIKKIQKKFPKAPKAIFKTE